VGALPDYAVANLSFIVGEAARLALSVPSAAGQRIALWSVYGLATTSERSAREIPNWVLGEFSNSVIIDEPLHERLPHEQQSNWQQMHLDHPRLFYSPVSYQQTAEDVPELDELKNVPGESDAEQPYPLIANVRCQNVDELVSLAHRAYRDVPDDHAEIGGQALLIGFCLEWNQRFDGGLARLPNAAAMGLKYERRAGDLVDCISSGALIVRRLVGS
jgi:hypothetical protein